MFRRKKTVEEANLIENPEAKIEKPKTPIEKKAEQINEMKAPEPPAAPGPQPEVDVLVQIIHDETTGMPQILAKENLDLLEIYAVGMPFMKAIEEKLVEKNFNNLEVKNG